MSDPVIALASTAGEVTRRGDYSLRATRTTDDELGDLVDAFNRMLERIEVRETELSQANEDLRREVAERRRAEQERAELLVREREANRLKDEFLATLSHELRTPLNAILGWTKLLRANAVPSPSIDRALEKVERNAQVQSRLIEDLLEVSRIVSGKLRLDYRPFDLITLCTTAVESMRPAAESRGVTIERHFERSSMPTSGDPDRLQQVVWNLLSNAVKFTPSGGRVSIAARRTGDVDEIVVSDTGIGIDAGVPAECVRDASARPTPPRRAPTAGSASGCRSSSSSSRCTAARCRPRAKARIEAPRSRCACPCARRNAAGKRWQVRRSTRSGAVSKDGTSWWWTTTSIRGSCWCRRWREPAAVSARRPRLPTRWR